MLFNRKMVGEVPTYLTVWSWQPYCILYAAWNRGKEPGRERGAGWEQYGIQCKQMEETEFQRDDSKAFCLLCSLQETCSKSLRMSAKSNDHIMSSTRHCEGIVEGVAYKSKGITQFLLSRSLQPIWETEPTHKTNLQSNININKYTYE